MDLLVQMTSIGNTEVLSHSLQIQTYLACTYILWAECYGEKPLLCGQSYINSVDLKHY